MPDANSIRQFYQQQAEKRKKMIELCSRFIKTPIVEMTPQDLQIFATRMTLDATNSIRIREDNTVRTMTQAEQSQYQNALISSIEYFNKNDEEHKTYMDYLVECKKQREEILYQEQLLKKKEKKNIIIHII